MLNGLELVVVFIMTLYHAIVHLDDFVVVLVAEVHSHFSHSTQVVLIYVQMGQYLLFQYSLSHLRFCILLDITDHVYDQTILQGRNLVLHYRHQKLLHDSVTQESTVKVLPMLSLLLHCSVRNECLVRQYFPLLRALEVNGNELV